jgi:DNA-binding CsgD family transcriptional regulator
MFRIEFSENEIKALNYERYHHPHPCVQRKMEALYLKSQGLSHAEICRLTRISGNTLRSYLRDYQAGGLEQLKALNFYRPHSALTAHRESLEAYFRNHPLISINQARAIIAERDQYRAQPFPDSPVPKNPRIEAPQSRDDPGQSRYRGSSRV